MHADACIHADGHACDLMCMYTSYALSGKRGGDCWRLLLSVSSPCVSICLPFGLYAPFCYISWGPMSLLSV